MKRDLSTGPSERLGVVDGVFGPLIVRRVDSCATGERISEGVIDA